MGLFSDPSMNNDYERPILAPGAIAMTGAGIVGLALIVLIACLIGRL